MDDKKIVNDILFRIDKKLDEINKSRSWLSMQLHVSPAAIHNWYKRCTAPKIQHLIKMTKLFKVDLYWLVYGEEERVEENG